MIETVKRKIMGFGVRRSDVNLTPRRQAEIASQRLANAGGAGLRAGDLPADAQTIMAQRGALAITEAEIEFIRHPDLALWVAKGTIAGSKQNGELLRAANVGSGLRFPNEEELLTANRLLGGQLDDANCLVWTSTPHPGHGESFALRRLGQDAVFFNFPDVAGTDYRIRFVIDKS